MLGRNCFRRLFIFWIGIASFLFGNQVVFALSNLKKIQVTDADRIDLIFDGKVSEDQIKTEYFNDIVQLSIQNAAVYPAKITAVSGSDLTKVFAYQYAPKLIRCRLTVKGAAQDYQSRVAVVVKGSLVSFKLIQGQGAVVKSTPSAPTQSEPLSDNQKQLLDKVLSTSEVTPQKSVSKPVKATAIATGAPLPSLGRAFAATFFVLLVFVVVVFAFKRARGGKLKGVLMKMSNLSRLGLTRKSAGLIEVVATHYLGPKKSIAVVKVGSRKLVLGITDESINLITQMEGDEGDDSDFLDQVIGQAMVTPSPKVQNSIHASTDLFSNTLSQVSSRPSTQQGGGARARIKSRLEGMKEL